MNFLTKYYQNRIFISAYTDLQRELGRWYLGSFKTLCGDRIVYISPTLWSALKNYKVKQDYLKQLYGNKYTYYYLEDVKINMEKLWKKRIVEITENYYILNTDISKKNVTNVFDKMMQSEIITEISEYQILEY